MAPVAHQLITHEDCPPNLFSTVMLAISWNLLDHAASTWDFFQACAEKNIEVLNVGVFASGVLVGAGTYKYRTDFPEDIKQRVEKWGTLAEKFGFALATVAVGCFATDCSSDVPENIRGWRSGGLLAEKLGFALATVAVGSMWVVFWS